MLVALALRNPAACTSTLYSPGRQIPDLIFAVSRGRGCPLDARRCLRNSNRGVGDHRATGIRYDSKNACIKRLRVQPSRHGQKRNQTCFHELSVSSWRESISTPDRESQRSPRDAHPWRPIPTAGEGSWRTAVVGRSRHAAGCTTSLLICLCKFSCFALGAINSVGASHLRGGYGASSCVTCAALFGDDRS